MKGYLHTGIKSECFGCEACAQVCARNAIQMQEDGEGFRYPMVDTSLCVECGLCNLACPYENMPQASGGEKLAFGGYHKAREVKAQSTSGGAFSAIAESWCNENYVIFGAAAEGLQVYHTYVEDKAQLQPLRKSKYSQSRMGTAYRQVKAFLKEGKKVLFSGTPCQIAGLRAFLGNADTDKLLTVEVICEGVPTPHFVRGFEAYMKKRHGAEIQTLDYRYKDMKKTAGKWDFEVMYVLLKNGRRFKKDRWFNPFWSIWLSHLMSRPSCYQCPFATTSRLADISLGDLWGVHLYCPELYGRNGGASLIVCNTEKGRQALALAKPLLYGHELDFATALKYQSPMRGHIDGNPNREAFMADVREMDYGELCKKWAKKPTAKLLWQKYIWGNRQKVFLWNLKNRNATKTD